LQGFSTTIETARRLKMIFQDTPYYNTLYRYLKD
jgi:hypothetical protein